LLNQVWYLLAGTEALDAFEEVLLFEIGVLVSELGAVFAGRGFEVRGGGGLLVGAFVALFGEVSELRCSLLGVLDFPAMY